MKTWSFCRAHCTTQDCPFCVFTDTPTWTQPALAPIVPVATIPTLPPGVSPDDIPLDFAIRAYSAISWEPEKRGAQMQAEYVNHLCAVWAELQPLASTPTQAAILATEWATYCGHYRTHFMGILAARSRTASAFVTGPARFPTERNRKRLDAEHNKVGAMLEWSQRAIKAIKKALQPAPTTTPAEDITTKIAQLEARQAHMVAVNKLVRKGDRAGLAALGISETNITRLFTPDFCGRIGYPDYELTNNSANIRRYKARLQEVSAAETQADTFQPLTGDGWQLDIAEDRVQITFDSKPDAAMLAALRSRAFLYSPTRRAHVRKYTPAALEAAKGLLNRT